MFMLLIIGMILFLTFESLLWKKNRKSPLVTLFGTTAWSLVFVGAAFLIMLTFTDNMFANLTWAYFGFLAIQVGLITINIVLWVHIMKVMPLSIAEPLTLLRVILLALFAFWIFSSPLSVPQIILGSAIVLGVMALGLIQGKKKAFGEENYRKGILLVLLWVASSVTLNLINQHIMRMGVHPMTHPTLQTALMFVAVTAFFIIAKPKEFLPACKTVFTNKIFMGIGLGGVGGRLCFFFALSIFGVNIGILTALQVAAVALVVALSALFYKERVKWYSYVIILIIIGAATALSLV